MRSSIRTMPKPQVGKYDRGRSLRKINWTPKRKQKLPCLLHSALAMKRMTRKNAAWASEIRDHAVKMVNALETRIDGAAAAGDAVAGLCRHAGFRFSAGRYSCSSYRRNRTIARGIGQSGQINRERSSTLDKHLRVSRHACLVYMKQRQQRCTICGTIVEAALRMANRAAFRGLEFPTRQCNQTP